VWRYKLGLYYASRLFCAIWWEIAGKLDSIFDGAKDEETVDIMFEILGKAASCMQTSGRYKPLHKHVMNVCVFYWRHAR
jgi:hypothetical protein